MKKRINIGYSIIFVMIFLTGCDKDWLDIKSDKAIVVPNRLKDLQALMDNTTVMNGNTIDGGVMPTLGEVGSDDYLLEESIWNNLNLQNRNAYIWSDDLKLEGSYIADWNYPYITVFYANVVLDELRNITIEETDTTLYNIVKGSALFFRAYAFYHLAQVFAVPYNNVTADTDLGIPIRLSSDFNELSDRATMRETYARILNDLSEAYKLLPDLPAFKTRPSKASSSGLAARVLLTMGDYSQALEQANISLEKQNSLMDYSELDFESGLPFDRFNEEVVFEASLVASAAINNHVVNPDLYEKYDERDLRKTAYFLPVEDKYRFRGSYSASTNLLFTGIATNEMYLIKAECYARMGESVAALETLNYLLTHRWDKEDGVTKYIEPTQLNVGDILKFVLNERRKELAFRGLRWIDLRRLNMEGHNIILKRAVGGNTYMLEPNSLKYTYPIPEQVVSTTGIEQNIR